MLASPVSGAWPHLDAAEWAFEMKWDGWRAQAQVGADGTVHIRSRTGRDITPHFPELRPALTAASTVTPVVLDAELVVLGPAGTPDFAALQRRGNLVDRARLDRLARTGPAHLMIFDVLRFDTVSTIDSGWDERRAVLEQLIVDGPLIHVPPVFRGDVDAALAAAAEHGLEGVVAKRRGSRYEPGRRSGAWVKLKLNDEADTIVLGWRPSKRRGVAALLLGNGEDGGYAGQLGGGWTAGEGRALAAELSARQTGEGDGWARVRPGVIVEVEHGGWTAGRKLRHPMWRGWRGG